MEVLLTILNKFLQLLPLLNQDASCQSIYLFSASFLLFRHICLFYFSLNSFISASCSSSPNSFLIAFSCSLKNTLSDFYRFHLCSTYILCCTSKIEISLFKNSSTFFNRSIESTTSNIC